MVGEKVVVGEELVEVRVLRGREYYEARAGCMLFAFRFDDSVGKGEGREGDIGVVAVLRNEGVMLMREIYIVSPLDLLKNPMILIAVVGLGFVVGMPYLMDSSTFCFSLCRVSASYDDYDG